MPYSLLLCLIYLVAIFHPTAICPFQCFRQYVKATFKKRGCIAFGADAITFVLPSFLVTDGSFNF